MRIGLIGLGNMGTAIASRLLAAGHELTVYNRTESKALPLLSQGATMAHDPAGTADGDIVITMLADDRALESIVFGTASDGRDGEDSVDSLEGLIAHQGKRTIHVSMSTISAQLSQRICEASAAQNKLFISAPVLGRPDVAQAGNLIVMAAGDQSAIDKCSKVFSAFAKSVHIMGTRPIQANIAKLAANFMISSMIETFGESFALLRKNDIDHHKFLQLTASEFFQSPVYEKYGKIIADEEFEGRAFTVQLQEKDTRLALAAAIESQVPMPFLTVLENTFLSAIGRGKGGLDPCAIAQIASENAGVSPRPEAARREIR
ncbi:MAG TPA: NAD(P)-dependent oxidoreductase [Trichormus sp.]|jgi:3-hydroxyisobutyrate dehydrogenase-like beta-hydroxyacid dehydrogenase